MQAIKKELIIWLDEWEWLVQKMLQRCLWAQSSGRYAPLKFLFFVFSVQIIAVTMSPKIEVSFQNFLYFIFFYQQRIKIIWETRHSRLRCVDRGIFHQKESIISEFFTIDHPLRWFLRILLKILSKSLVLLQFPEFIW